VRQGLNGYLRHDAAYPSVAFVGDEALAANYTRRAAWARDCEILLKIFPTAAFSQ
jgi:hypothetical protein